MRYRVRVRKEYQHRDHGASHTLFGDLTVEAESPAAAEAAVRDLMAGQSGCVLQTVDPRIEWEEDWSEGEGWDYLDWSFEVVSHQAQKVRTAD